jgi:hypothetical protein
MIVEITKIKNMFSSISWSIERFMNKFACHTDREILAYNFPNYARQAEEIEQLLQHSIEDCLEKSKHNQRLIRYYKVEFDSFFNKVMKTYYENFERKFDTGRLQDITPEILNKDANLMKTLLEEFGQRGFEQYKVTIYDVLQAFKIDVELMDQKVITRQVIDVANSNTDTYVSWVDKTQITRLYDLCVEENVIYDIDYGNFYKCFDFAKVPPKFPKYNNMIMFVYALKNITGMKNAIALKNFDISNYDKHKSVLNKREDKDRRSVDPIASKNRKLTRKIDKIFIEPNKNE